MMLPGFNAEQGLYATGQRYAGSGAPETEPAAAVVPAARRRCFDFWVYQRIGTEIRCQIGYGCAEFPKFGWVNHPVCVG